MTIAKMIILVLGLISRTSSRVNSRRKILASSRRAVADASIAACSMKGATCVLPRRPGTIAVVELIGKKWIDGPDGPIQISSPSLMLLFGLIDRPLSLTSNAGSTLTIR
jgi:hypothetical protein